jgi:uncharacterized protein (DUF2267 family)
MIANGGIEILRRRIMAITGMLDFLQSSLDEAQDWVRQLDDELHWDDPHKSFMALRAVLHVLRDRLPAAEAAQVAAQMPVLIRGIFYEGWQPGKTPLKIRTRAEFLEQVRREFKSGPQLDPQWVSQAVCRVLSRKISAGEWQEVCGNLPEDIRALCCPSSPTSV